MTINLTKIKLSDHQNKPYYGLPPRKDSYFYFTRERTYYSPKMRCLFGLN